MKLPAFPKNIGKSGMLITREKQRRHFTIKNEVAVSQNDYREKRIYLQLVEFVNNGKKELRLGYYVIGKRSGKWVWGRNSAFVPISDFKKLLRMAKKKGMT